MPPHDERLKLADWLKRLRELAVLCRDAEDGAAGQLLLQVEDALRRAPRALKSWFGPIHSKSDSARLMAAGADVSFVLGLCSDQMSYLLSRSAAGNCLVTVAFPELEQESSFASPDLSIAIAGALLTLIVEIVGGGRVPLGKRSRQALN
jgi:hypothetical protein